jgi:hypothetical protein
MVHSLYVCEFPQDIEEKELKEHFTRFEGFEDLRIA